MINHFFNYEFIYIFLLLSLIFAFDGLFIKNKIVKKVSLLFFAIFYSLFFVEFILSLFMPLPVREYKKDCLNKITDKTLHNVRDIKYVDENNMIIRFCGEMFDDVKFSDGVLSSLLYDKTYKEYSNGFRYTKCNENSNETYLFFGCSFTFGIGVNDDETLPYYFSKMFNFGKNIINCGVGAQATNTSFNILNNDVFEYLIPENSKIKHCFYSLIKDHIYRNFRCEGHCIDSYLYKNGKFIRVKQPYGIFKNIFANSYIFRKVFLPLIDERNEDYYENYLLNALQKIDAVLKEKYNSKLTLIVWPSPVGYREEFINKLKQINMDILFVPENFLSYDAGYLIEKDGHPAAKANEEIATELFNYIKGLN